MGSKFCLALAVCGLAFGQTPRAVQAADGSWYSATEDQRGIVVEKRSADFATVVWRQIPNYVGLRALKLAGDGGVALLGLHDGSDAVLWKWDAEGNEKLRVSIQLPYPMMTVDTNGDILLGGDSLLLIRLGADGVEKSRRKLAIPGLDLGIVGIEPDGRGGIFLVGNTNSTTLPVTQDAYQRAPRSGLCIVGFRFPSLQPCGTVWVARVNSASFALEALSYLGGADHNTASGLSIDADGLPVIVGSATQRVADQDPYPQTLGTARTFAEGKGLVLTIARMSSRLDALVDATWLRGAQTASGSAVYIDADGKIVLTGTTTSPNFPGTADEHPVCGPVRSINTLGWGLGLQLSSHFERVERVLHLNEVLAASRLPLAAKVNCLFDGANYEFVRSFALGQTMVVIGGPFGDDDVVRVDGVTVKELYRSSTQINFVLPRELGVMGNADVTVGGAFARAISVEAARPRWKLYVDGAGKLTDRGNFLIEALRADDSRVSDSNPVGTDEEVRAYATGIDLALPLKLFLNFYDGEYPGGFTASYVAGTFDSVVEFRFRNGGPQGGMKILGIMNGGAYSGSNPGYIWSQPVR